MSTRKRKLVRDVIPRLNNAKEFFTNPRFERATTKEARLKLAEKLVEESQEVLEAAGTFSESPTRGNKQKILEELADLFEVFSMFGEIFEFTGNELEEAAKKKRDERGGFKEFWIVEYDA